MPIRETEHIKITYRDNPELRKEVFQKLLEWYLKHEAFHEDSIIQNDEAAMDAAPFLSDLVETMEFDIEYKEEEGITAEDTGELSLLKNMGS